MIRRYLLAGSIAVALVVLDLVTKRHAALNFVDERVVLIPGFLEFTYHENPGAAFSLFRDGGQLIGVVVIIVVGAVIWTLRNHRPTTEVVVFGMIIGGALGNLADRVFRGDGFLDGKVIDWIDLWWIPTFNVADMSVFLAVVVLLIHSWTTKSN